METYAIIGTIAGIIAGIIIILFFCQEGSKKSTIRRMQIPSVDQIAIVCTTGAGSYYCLVNFCPKCLTTSCFHEDYCSDCGTRIISLRPFKTCKICLTEQGCGEHCKKCGHELEKYHYIRDHDKENPNTIFSPRIYKLNPDYKKEKMEEETEEKLVARKRPMFSLTRD